MHLDAVDHRTVQPRVVIDERDHREIAAARDARRQLRTGIARAVHDDPIAANPIRPQKQPHQKATPGHVHHADHPERDGRPTRSRPAGDGRCGEREHETRDGYRMESRNDQLDAHEADDRPIEASDTQRKQPAQQRQHDHVRGQPRKRIADQPKRQQRAARQGEGVCRQHDGALRSARHGDNAIQETGLRYRALSIDAHLLSQRSTNTPDRSTSACRKRLPPMNAYVNPIQRQVVCTGLLLVIARSESYNRRRSFFEEIVAT